MLHDLFLRLIQSFMDNLSALSRRAKKKAGQELLMKEKTINNTINEMYTLFGQLLINEAPSKSICQI